MIHIQLFPTQTETDNLFLIVCVRSGVTYHNQCGGTSCAQKEAQGGLIPIGTPEDLKRVRDWFERNFGESYWDDGRLGDNGSRVQELSAEVARLRYFEGDDIHWLELDHGRILQGCEAWVPVRSPHGRGWLTWTNSD